MRSLHVEMDNISREDTTFRLLFFEENQFPLDPSGNIYTPVLPTGIWGGFDGEVFDEANTCAHYLTTNAKTDQAMINSCHVFYEKQSFHNNGYVVSVEQTCCSSLHWLLPTCTERNPVLHVLLGTLTDQESEERLKHHLKYAADIAPVNARIAEALEKSRLQYVYDCFHETLHPALNAAHEARRIDPVTHAWGDPDAELEKYYMRAAQASMPGAHKAPWLLLKTSAPDAFADWPRGEKIESERLESMLPLFQTSVHKALREAHESRRGTDDWGDEMLVTNEAFYINAARTEAGWNEECTREARVFYTLSAVTELGVVALGLDVHGRGHGWLDTQACLREADAVEDARLEEILSRFNGVVHKALREAHETRRGNSDWGNESENECEVMAWYTMVARREASRLNIQEFLVGQANAFEDGRLEALLHCFKDFVHDALRKAHAKRRNEPVKYAWGDQSAETDEAFYDDVLRAEGVLHPGCQTSTFPGF